MTSCIFGLINAIQRPHGLKHKMSSPAQTLGSWVRIPLKEWMSLCVYSMFALGNGLTTG
jgi:hypothetical protein